MIELYQLHNALRFAGFCPDIPYHQTDSTHELKLRRLLDELSDDPLPDPRDERIEELESELHETQESEREAKDDLQKEEKERRAAERHVSRLTAEINALEEKAQGAAQ